MPVTRIDESRASDSQMLLLVRQLVTSSMHSRIISMVGSRMFRNFAEAGAAAHTGSGG